MSLLVLLLVLLSILCTEGLDRSPGRIQRKKTFASLVFGTATFDRKNPCQWLSKSKHQSKICLRRRGLSEVLLEARKLAVNQCQKIFRYDQWNCTSRDVYFKRIYRESAFLYAISSSALMYSIAKACSEGSLPYCKCGEVDEKMPNSQFYCAFNTKLAQKLTQKFLQLKKRGDEFSSVVRYNSEVGLRAVLENQKKTCKCHGVSVKSTMSILVFKVWNAKREQRKCFALKDEGELLQALIDRASSKMHIQGARLVLENDGSEVDDVESLRLLRNEVFLLLGEKELWSKAVEKSDSFSSTITLYEDSPKGSPQINLNPDSPLPPSRSSTPISNRSPSRQSDGSSTPHYLLTSRSTPNSSMSRSSSPSAPPTVNESTWVDFKIPTEKFSSTSIQDFKSGIRNLKSMKEAVHIVASEMMHLSSNVPSKACKLVASKLVAMYSKTFQDCDDDGVIIGDGSITVYSQLKDHIKYVKTSQKRSRGEKESTTVPVNKRKKMSNCKAGCSTSAWQPSPEPDVDCEDAETKLKTVDFQIFDEDTQKLMKICYPQQRLFLNKPEPPTLQEVQEKWPILLSHKGLSLHFEMLMGKKITMLTDTLFDKANKFFKLGLKRKLIDHVPTDNESIILAVLKIVTEYFGESINSMIAKINNISEVPQLPISKAPTICFLDTEEPTKYFVVMEMEAINNGSTLTEALLEMFGLYYIFNLEYPKDISNTMELIQMYFLKIHPEQGSRNNKKSSKPKIVGLLNKLKDRL